MFRCITPNTHGQTERRVYPHATLGRAAVRRAPLPGSCSHGPLREELGMSNIKLVHSLYTLFITWAPWLAA